MTLFRTDERREPNGRPWAAEPRSSDSPALATPGPESVQTLPGFAVVDLETTGIHPGYHERVIEVAVVHVSPDGLIEGEWETLVNPDRDLGPQGIHGITGAEVRHAPTFAEVAGTLAAMLRGRAFVAHNARFDVSFLTAEFGQLGVAVPLNTESCLCTMSLARRYLPSAGRSLVDCCTALNVPLPRHHRAAVDAHATAELLIGYLTIDPTSPNWTEAMRRSVNLAWPSLPINDSPWCCREAAGSPPEHFLARMASQVSAASTPASLRDNDVEYLALLDRVLLDRYVSFPEADALVASADDLGIERSTAQLLHRKYLAGLVAAAWTDGVITEQEREDVNLVATLLAVSDAELTDLIDSVATESQPTGSFDAFQLHVGDLVVFTGQMTRDRATWEAEAAAAGLVPWKGITKKVKLLVAADPDSLSGKAKLAQEYGIPVVNEPTFGQLIQELNRK